MKEAVVLVLVLIVVFSSQLFSETLDCQQSFELGKVAAKEEYKVWDWYLLGISTGQFDLLMFWWSDYSYDPFAYSAAPVAAVALNVTVFISAFIFPLRSRVFPSSSDVDLECYRDGYTIRASWKNLGALALGELTVLLVPIAVFGYALMMN